MLGPSQLVMTILEAAEYIFKPIFGVKRVKLDLPWCFDGKLVALNKWLFEIENYYRIVGQNRSTDMIKLDVSYLEKDAHMWWR